MTKVDVKSAGPTYPTISGNFTSYRSYQNATFATAQVPFIGSPGAVAINVPYQSSGNAMDFQVSVWSYDPSGREYALFNGQVLISTSTTTTTIIATATTTATTILTSVSTATSVSTSTATHTATETATVAATSTILSTVTETVNSGGGGVPQSTLGLVVASALVAVLIVSFLFVRARSVHK
jgi:hypothetical protein